MEALLRKNVAEAGPPPSAVAIQTTADVLPTNHDQSFQSDNRGAYDCEAASESWV